MRVVRDVEHHPISESELNQILGKLPQRAKEGIYTVHLSSKPEGSYQVGNNITFGTDIKFPKFAIPHEFAHNLWKNLSNKEHAEYKTVIGDRYFPRGEISEAFADDFATVFDNRIPYDIPKERRQTVTHFMRKLINPTQTEKKQTSKVKLPKEVSYV